MALFRSRAGVCPRCNGNDVVVLVIFIAIIGFFIYGWHDMHAVFSNAQVKAIDLGYQHLPYYALRTGMRLVIALFFSMIFTLVFGVLAAKYAPMRRVILPFVNFMESVPLVGFLTFTTVYFLNLYPHSMMGLEWAAIFAVFTGQAWNMMLTLYQTLCVVPKELTEATSVFHYNPWQRFWRVGFLYSFPGLLWNTMVSQSSAWFAMIASEAVPVKNQNVNLPGIGAYLAKSLATGNMHAVGLAIIALVATIIIFDQLLFRPLVCYANQFKYEDVPSQRTHSSWFYYALGHSLTGYFLGQFCQRIAYIWLFVLPRIWYGLRLHNVFLALGSMNWLWSSLWYLVIFLLCCDGIHHLWFIFPKQYLIDLPDWMGLTAMRVIAAMLLSIIIFTPIGIWIGLSPARVRFFQPIIQVLGALPANLLYPFIAIVLVTFHQQLGWWTIPMIMLGTQWYILFNVIAGVSMLPNQMVEVSRVFHVKGVMWWTKFILPAVFPYLVTGIISAAGGAWNTAIAAEVLDWGSTQLSTTGLGAFISQTTQHGAIAQAALGCAAMCVMVALCIVFIWHPLYRYAETRFKIE